jgi:rhamnulokinase
VKTKNVIAFDIGAASGRVCVGYFDGSRMRVEEKHRFLNEPVKVLNNLQWDILKIFSELKCALSRLDKTERYVSVGIDGWGADYGLIDRRGRLLGNVYHYRDSRTDQIVEKLLEKIPLRELCASTASDLKRHYTLCQLYSQVINGDPLLEAADKLLLIPDLLTYLFTGSIAAEITIAGTSQLLGPGGESWNQELLSRVGIRATLLPAIVRPPTNLGPLLPGYGIETGSAN